MSSEHPEESEDEHLSPTVCHLCRQRKTKCDRRLPSCSFCVRAKVGCRYVERPKKRGLRAGYVSELEARLASLEQKFEAFKSQGPTSSHGPLSSPSGDSRAWSTPNLSTDQHVDSPLFPGPVKSENTSAVDDLMSLPRTFFQQLADLWFKETQPWLPILNHEHIEASLLALPVSVDRIDDIELRAVVALEMSYSTQAIGLGYHGRRRLSQYLRSETLSEAMAKPSMSSLRALLIIAFLDYGMDDIPSTFSLMAVCRRMCENIGTFRQLLKRIEGESPAQVGPPAVDLLSTADDTIPLTWSILAFDAVSTLGISWRDVSAALIDHLSSIAYISTPDFRDSFRTHTHLAAIGLQPVHEFLSAQARHPAAVDDPMGSCAEMCQNLINYVDGLPETSYSLLPDGTIDFDINQIFTKLLVHGAIIILYQRFVTDDDGAFAQVAQRRCIESYAKIISTMRSISDTDTEINNSPVAATFLFVAARFKLAFCRALSHPREALFDILMHGINMLGRRWQLARRLDIVLRVAILEVDTGSTTSLPTEFWDLTNSHLDISENLKTWVGQYKPSLFIGNLDGPYV